MAVANAAGGAALAGPQPGFHYTPRGAWSRRLVAGGIHHKIRQDIEKKYYYILLILLHPSPLISS